MFKQVIQAFTVSALLLGSTIPVTADHDMTDDAHRYNPSAEQMILDGLVYRPLSFAGTVIGTGLYIVTLPFSLAGGNEDQARERLIVEPANATFNRCLGCIDTYHNRRHQY